MAPDVPTGACWLPLDRPGLAAILLGPLTFGGGAEGGHWWRGEFLWDRRLGPAARACRTHGAGGFFSHSFCSLPEWARHRRRPWRRSAEREPRLVPGPRQPVT